MDDIEDVYGKRAVAEVAAEFENLLLENDLKLVSAGFSLLDGKEYFKLNRTVTSQKLKLVQKYFTDFETGWNIEGLATCEPMTVSMIFFSAAEASICLLSTFLK